MALLTELLRQLATAKPVLSVGVVAVFIADEEVGDDPDVGVDHLCREGELEFIKHGPLYWLDSADIHPTVGCGSMIAWKLTAHGKRGHRYVHALLLYLASPRLTVVCRRTRSIRC